MTFTIGLRRGVLEIKQFLRNRVSVVFTMLMPVLLLVIFGAVFDREISPEVTFAQYFVAGIMAGGLLATGFQAIAIQIPIERDRGVLKRLAGTPMPRGAYFVGKVVLVLFIGAVETILLLTLGVLFYGVSLPDSPARWFTFAWVFVLGIASCTLCGVAFSAVPRRGRGAPSIVTPVALVFQFISGVFFVYTDLPGWMRQLGALFPLKWMSQGMRSVFLPDSFAALEAGGSWELGRTALVLGAWCVLAFGLCLLSFRWTDRA